MKYIRTEDGRIAEVKDNMFIKETTIEIINQKGLRLVYKDRPYTCVLNGSEDYIIKQANTIEELCDWFIVEGDDNEITYRKTLFSAETEGKDYILESNETYTIYGCVLVKGKGLIYVAKMNKNGELELL